MRVILAKTAGFCYGVERAVALAHETAKAHGGAMLGSVIHNANVVAELEREGMRLIASPEEAAAGETVLIRSHGESREVLEELQARGAEIVSATCPNVRHIQSTCHRGRGRGAAGRHHRRARPSRGAGHRKLVQGRNDLRKRRRSCKLGGGNGGNCRFAHNDGRADHLYSCALGKLREISKKRVYKSEN